MKRAASLCLLTVLIAGAVLAGVGSAASDPGWGAAGSLEANNLDAAVPPVAVAARGSRLPARRAGGGAWGTAERIETDNAGSASAPQVAVDAAGNAVAVWHQSDGTRTNIWANRYAVGAGWGPAPLVETLDLGDAEYPDVAMDAAGNALAGWYQFDGTRFDVWANRFVPSAGWGTAQRIENGADNAFGPALAMDRSGNGVAVFTQFDGTVFNAWANRYAVGSGGGGPA